MVERTPEQIANFKANYNRGLLYAITKSDNEIDRYVHQSRIIESWQSRADVKPTEKPRIPQGELAKEIEQVKAQSNYVFNKLKELQAKKKKNDGEAF